MTLRDGTAFVGVIVSKPLLGRIDALAKKMEISRSEMVRFAVFDNVCRLEEVRP